MIDGDGSKCDVDSEEHDILGIVRQLKDKDSIAMTSIGLAQLRLTIQDSVNMDNIIREVVDNLIEVKSSDLTELYNVFMFPDFGPVKNIESIGKFFGVWYDGYIESIHDVIKTIVENKWCKVVCVAPGTIRTLRTLE